MASTDPLEPDLIRIDPDPTPQEEADQDFEDPERTRRRLANRQLAQDIEERQRFSRYAYRITIGWIAFLFLLTAAELTAGFFGGGLASEEFIALVTTTTASVFGFWWLVGKYLFDRGD